MCKHCMLTKFNQEKGKLTSKSISKCLHSFFLLTSRLYLWSCILWIFKSSRINRCFCSCRDLQRRGVILLKKSYSAHENAWMNMLCVWKWLFSEYFFYFKKIFLKEFFCFNFINSVHFYFVLKQLWFTLLKLFLYKSIQSYYVLRKIPYSSKMNGIVVNMEGRRRIRFRIQNLFLLWMWVASGNVFEWWRIINWDVDYNDLGWGWVKCCEC